MWNPDSVFDDTDYREDEQRNFYMQWRELKKEQKGDSEDGKSNEVRNGNNNKF